MHLSTTSALLANCAFVLLFCFSVSASPILIDGLAPSIIGVEVEDRIANPSSAESRSAAAARNPSSAASKSLMDELVPAVVGVEVEDRISNPSSSSSSSSLSSDLVSIGDMFAPDVTSVDVSDEERAHREEIPDKNEEGSCVGEGCECPPGTKGVQPFCIPIESGSELPATHINEYGEQEIPIEFYQKIAGVKNIEEFINMTKIDVSYSAAGAYTTLPAEGCIPKKVCVSVRPKNRHPSEDVFPNSVDVERCGGCCGHPDLSCLPWSTEPMTVNLLRYGYNPDGTISNLGFTSTSVIREVKCKCVKVQT